MKYRSCFYLLLFMLSIMIEVGCIAKVTGMEDEVSPSISHEPKSIIIEKEGNPAIELYDTFAEFEPLLRKNNDTTYVINFWATWCKPCVAELPVFEEFNSRLKNQKVKVILCSLDFPNAIESSLYPFVKKHELQSKVVVLLDGKFNNWIDKISPEWSGAIPATYVYKGNKKIFVEKSFENVNELEVLIKEVI